MNHKHWRGLTRHFALRTAPIFVVRNQNVSGNAMAVLKIDHVQVAIPWGKVAEALSFYEGVLQFARVPKPAELDQSGAWLVQGLVNLHLGEEKEFEAARRAHPALLVDNIELILDKAERGGHALRIDDGPTGYKRASVFDPFGNRIELMQKM
jgi:catechol 2,3-dioxygenase-like lactoylglutathione lyase family enzyme